MMHMHVNYLAVVVAAIAAMIVGFVWYSRSLLGRMWIKIIGKENMSQAEQEQMKKDARPYFGIVFAGTLVRAFVFALFVRGLHVYPAVEGMQVGFWAVLGSASYSPLCWARPCSAAKRRIWCGPCS